MIPDDVTHDLNRRLADFLADHRGELLEHARRELRGRCCLADADDIVQAASIAFVLNLRPRQDVHVGSSLLVLARQCVETAINDQLKWQFAQKRCAERSVEPIAESGVASPATGPATAAARADRRQLRERALQQVLQELDPIARRVVQLRNLEPARFGFAQIGAILGTTEDAARMRYNRALEEMKPRLHDLLGDDSLCDLC
jgi:RNA polymerase sigma factor (sigma-70 family)